MKLPKCPTMGNKTEKWKIRSKHYGTTSKKKEPNRGMIRKKMSTSQMKKSGYPQTEITTKTSR